MGAAYSMDLRKRVMADLDAGIGPTQLSRRYHVDRSWINKLSLQRKRLGHIAPLSGRTGRPPKLPDAESLRALVAECPDATLEELCQKLPVRVCTSTLCRALQRLKLTLKKVAARG